MPKPIESKYKTNVIIEHGNSHVPFEMQYQISIHRSRPKHKL
jgi:hypothetical protein